MKTRFFVLDTFRGMAALLVFFFHLNLILNSVLVNNEFIKNAYLFVDFFFILSGFVITYNYDSRIKNISSFGKFISKRFWRLYPLHFVLLMVFLAYFFFRIYFHFDFKPGDLAINNTTSFISNLLLLNSVKWNSHIKDLSWNEPGWSVSAEMFSYILFALCCLFFSNKKVRSVIIAIVTVVSFGLLYSIRKVQSFNYTYDYGFLRGIFGFMLGYFTFRLYKICEHKNLKRIQLSILEIIAVIATIIIIGNANKFIDNNGLVIYLLFSFIVLLFSLEGGVISGWLNPVAASRFLGNISYSIYLNHFFIIIVFTIVLKRVPFLNTRSQVINFIILFALTVLLIAISAITYRYIEVRFKNGFKKKKEQSEQVTMPGHSMEVW